MSDFNYSKKSMFYCAWCDSQHTFIGMKKVIDSKPKFPYGLLPYPNQIIDEKIDYSHPFFVIIKCDDCHKYSSVKSILCKTCNHNDVFVKKIFDKIHPDDLFDMTELHEYVCKHCNHFKPVTYCEHSWVKVSGEIFSECTVYNLVCKKCRKKKSTYSNQDTYLEPWSTNEYC